MPGSHCRIRIGSSYFKSLIWNDARLGIVQSTYDVVGPVSTQASACLTYTLSEGTVYANQRCHISRAIACNLIRLQSQMVCKYDIVAAGW